MNKAETNQLNLAFLLTRSDTVGGVQNHVVEIAAALIRDGHKATVLCGGEGQYFQKLKDYNVPYRSIPALSNSISLTNDRNAYIDVKKYLDELKPDIVSTHSTKAGLIGRLACHKLQLPVLFTAHGWAFTDGVGTAKQIVYRHMERWLAKRTTHIICVSNFDKLIAIEAGIPETKLTTVHNGRLTHQFNSKASSSRSTPTIIMIGRLDNQKDHVTLFKALETLKNEQPFNMVLLGDGPKHEEYQRLASTLGLEDRIEFKGLVRDVPSELLQADLFTLITHYEGFPRSTLEAMCAGLPVIVSDAGGSAEAVVNGKSGYVVDKGDAAAVATALQELLSNESKRIEMGRVGRELFLEKFTFETMYKKTIDIYTDVIATTRY